MGQSTVVEKVVIYNGDICCLVYTDCCNGRLSNSIVTLRDGADNVVYSYRIGDASQLDKIDIEISMVIKVKIQLEGTNYLHMREVQVFDYTGVNVAQNKPATQSSTQVSTVSDWSGGEAGKAVDGNLTTISHTNSQQGKHQLCIKLRTLMNPLTFVISPQVLGGKWTWVKVL